ncbi:SRPBCC family protein [Nocardia sp. NPDC056100]|uniref:SRPBCC family protein n=1 Tax=Nocardia sp. NPDC056100 TaxID=3345712 RepID=UPI0035DFEB34
MRESHLAIDDECGATARIDGVNAMYTVELERTITAPIGEVFDWLTDITNYSVVSIVRRVNLIRPGDVHSAGAGAVREVRTRLLTLTEQIIEYRRPTLLRYRIIRSRPRLRHEDGYLAFDQTPAGTRVRWHTRFEVASPLGSGPLTAAMGLVIATGFHIVLRTAADELGRLPAHPGPDHDQYRQRSTLAPWDPS